ncbi:MAG: hypothetical protein GF383_00440 [Candidatus Lokiarchaeota archaeon]|nr:hypothetical protein [Candidatus Lokiarchaeota archaeon]
MANHYRIMKVKDGKVTFSWKDYRDENKQKEMTVDAFEFIRRFLLHVLPHGFFKMRYYGILSNRNRRIKPEKCRNFSNITMDENITDLSLIDCIQLFTELTGIDLRVCPQCKGRMTVRQQPILPSHAPS